MAEKRICPACGAVWYSADSANIWICENCGAEITPQDSDTE